VRAVFVDTVYWIAIIRPGDPWKGAATRARELLGNVRLLTTDEVLTEFLAALRTCGENLRRAAAKMVKAILENPNVKVIPQSRDTFLRGVEFYERRLDKKYSLTDCISMNAMKAESVREVLSNDHHFEQEGFQALMAQRS